MLGVWRHLRIHQRLHGHDGLLQHPNHRTRVQKPNMDDILAPKQRELGVPSVEAGATAMDAVDLCRCKLPLLPAASGYHVPPGKLTLFPTSN